MGGPFSAADAKVPFIGDMLEFAKGLPWNKSAAVSSTEQNIWVNARARRRRKCTIFSTSDGRRMRISSFLRLATTCGAAFFRMSGANYVLSSVHIARSIVQNMHDGAFSL